MINKIKYYWRLMKWLYENRDCPNNRAKWKRLDREVKDDVTEK